MRQTVGSDTTNYLWDEFSAYGDVVRETNGTGTELASYTLADTQLLGQTRSGVTSYYLSDGQGSTRALLNGTGDLTDTYEYTAFGEIYNQTGSTLNSYLYTGQQFDSLTGLYSLRARYYDPGVGRFVSRDMYPINYQNPIELNRYGYVGNNPINGYDPTGMSFVDLGARLVDALKTIGFYALIGAYTAYLYCYTIYMLSEYTGEYIPVCGVDAVERFVNGDMDWQGFGDDDPEPEGNPLSWIAVVATIIGTTTLMDWFTDVANQSEPEPEPQPQPQPEQEKPQDPPQNEECDPTTDEECQERSIMTIYRGLDGEKHDSGAYFKKAALNPGQFKLRPGIDDDGLSTYVIEDLPGNKPYAFPFTIEVTLPLVPNVTMGPIIDDPSCTATYTPYLDEFGILKRHWSINCLPPDPQGTHLSDYAKRNKNRVILNPHWSGQPQDRRL